MEAVLKVEKKTWKQWRTQCVMAGKLKLTAIHGGKKWDDECSMLWTSITGLTTTDSLASEKYKLWLERVEADGAKLIAEVSKLLAWHRSFANRHDIAQYPVFSIEINNQNTQANMSYMLRLSASPRCRTTTREASVRLSSDRVPVGMVTWNVGWIGSFFLVSRGDVGGLEKKHWC